MVYSVANFKITFPEEIKQRTYPVLPLEFSYYSFFHTPSSSNK